MRDRSRPTESRRSPAGRLRADNRAVTTTLSYVLTLTITAALVSGLLIAAGSAVEDRRQEVARDELNVVGQGLGARLAAADRLAATGTDPAVRVAVSMPRSVGGASYRIEAADGDPATLILSSDDADTSVRVSVPLRTPLNGTDVRGGDVAIVLTDGGALEVRPA